MNLHESQSGIEARAPKFPARSLIGTRNSLFRWIVNSPSTRSKFSALSWNAGLNKVPFRKNALYFPSLTRDRRHGGAGRDSLPTARSTTHSRLRTGPILVALKLADFRRLGRDDDGAETAPTEIFRPVCPTVSVGRLGAPVFRVAQHPLSAGKEASGGETQRAALALPLHGQCAYAPLR